jgi:hypothetical protein
MPTARAPGGASYPVAPGGRSARYGPFPATEHERACHPPAVLATRQRGGEVGGSRPAAKSGAALNAPDTGHPLDGAVSSYGAATAPAVPRAGLASPAGASSSSPPPAGLCDPRPPTPGLGTRGSTGSARVWPAAWGVK